MPAKPLTRATVKKALTSMVRPDGDLVDAVLESWLRQEEALQHYATEAHWSEEPGDVYTTWGYDGGHALPWKVAQAALAARPQVEEERTFLPHACPECNGGVWFSASCSACGVAIPVPLFNVALRSSGALPDVAAGEAEEKPKTPDLSVLLDWWMEQRFGHRVPPEAVALAEVAEAAERQAMHGPMSHELDRALVRLRSVLAGEEKP